MSQWLTGWFQAVFLYTNGVSYFENVTNWQTSEAIDDAYLEGQAGMLVSFYQNQLRPIMPNNIGLVDIIVTAMEGPGGFQAHANLATPMYGLVAGQVLPMNVTVAVKLNTGRAGRSYRGRIYHIGLMESQVTGDGINANDLVALAGAYEDLPDWLADGNAHLIVLSRFFQNQLRATPLATRVTSISIDPVVDSQRRRLSGRGR